MRTNGAARAKRSADTNAVRAETSATTRAARTKISAPTKSEVLLAGCPLARRVVGGCGWCGTALPARRRTWCSERCSGDFWKNHWWTLARRAAKRRDRYRCTRCGAAAPKRPSATTSRSKTAYRAALRAWRAAKKLDRMEVNHRVPCRGAHTTLSCAHHLDNLETLCPACHREHTLDAAMRRRLTTAKPQSDAGR